MKKKVGMAAGLIRAGANATYKKALITRNIGEKKEGTIYRMVRWVSK